MDENSLSLDWVYGFSKDKRDCVHSLCVENRNALFFISSHSGVIYDFEHRTQTILLGHCNAITCCAVDKAKRFIVTADSGPESIMIIWDAATFAPLKTYHLPHDTGVSSLDMSDDACYITTLSALNNDEEDSESKQEIAVWAWTQDDSDSILRQHIVSSEEHYSIKFNPSDNFQIVTTCAKSVCYWSWEEFQLESYVGYVLKSDIGTYSGHFETTVFLPGTENAVTATSEGYVIMWETSRNPTTQQSSKCMKVPTKILYLVECGINILMTTANKYIVAACADGAVRFYDYYLRLEAWFEDLNAGPVSSISFSVQPNPFPASEAGSPGLKFWVPDFIVGTSHAFMVGIESIMFNEVKKEDRRGTLLMQGMTDTVIAVACHPSQSLVAIVCGNGVLQLWNYDMKLLMVLREFNSSDIENSKTGKTSGNFKPNCIAFDSTGLLAIGFSSGAIKLLVSDSLEDIAHYTPSTDSIQHLQFSPTGDYLAAIDNSNHVLIFKRESLKDSRHSDKFEFVYLGRALSHTKRIVGIDFGFKDIHETLVSVSEDRYVVEYDLPACSVSSGVVCIKTKDEMGYWHSSSKLEVFATPTAVMWHPKSPNDAEDRFIIANDEFKLKEINIQSKLCRKTSLAPRFGSPIVRMLPIPVNVRNYSQEEVPTSSFYAFATAARVIGIGSLPLTGDPLEIMGVIAHPQAITSIAASFDGKYIFSTGGSDLSANMWRIDTSQSMANKGKFPSGANTLSPSFLSLLEGGNGGDLHKDIINYFYYCQLRSLGEDSMWPRKLSNMIALEDIPSLARSIGFYPSEEEALNMIDEVKYKHFGVTGEVETHIGLDDFIKLYLNHRPVVPLDKVNIAKAFENISGERSDDGQSPTLTWEQLVNCVSNYGELISPSDLDTFVTALTGAKADTIDPSTGFQADSFSEEMLGFEE